MLYVFCVIAGIIATFHSIGVMVYNFEPIVPRAIQFVLVVALDFLAVVLATIFMPAVASYLFTFAFTRGLMYGISDLENILTIKTR